MATDDGEWWETWIRERTAHEQGMYLHQESRAKLLATSCGVLAAFGLQWLVDSGAGAILQGVAWSGLLLLALGAFVFWQVLTPMLGRHFPRGSLAARLSRVLKLRARSDDLAGEVRRLMGPDDAVATHQEARRRLAQWISRVESTDLSWWLADPEDEAQLRTIERRVRIVFYLWSTRQGLQRKSELLHLGMTLAGAGGGLVIVALALQGWSWWAIGLGVVLAAVLGGALSDRPMAQR